MIATNNHPLPHCYLHQWVEEMQGALPALHPVQHHYAALRLLAFDRDYAISTVRDDLLTMILMLARLIAGEQDEAKRRQCYTHLHTLHALHGLLADINEAVLLQQVVLSRAESSAELAGHGSHQAVSEHSAV